MAGHTGNGLDPAGIPSLVRESFALVEHISDKVVGHFYALIFTECPEVRDMFPPMMDAQRDRIVRALIQILGRADHLDELAESLRRLGRDHRKFGARPEHYDVVWRCLISSLKYHAGSAWTADMDAAWVAAYQLVAGTMMEAAEEDARLAPAWWTARVVHHELRARDIAVVTLLPDNPYPYRPGQYLSLETQRWPRVWRQFSLANAPRPDNTLTLHVRAVPAGWVSNALVNHTRVGDVVRLGPPLGTMTCNTASARDVLCVAGGTGLAPIKAILEDMAAWNTNRTVRLFFGARRAEELYDTADLVRLAERHPWLSIVSPVSHDPRYPGERGMLPDVVARHGEWHSHWTGHDVYVAGSASMVRSTVARLQELDIPLANIRFDAYGGMDHLWQGGGGQGLPMPSGPSGGLTPTAASAPSPWAADAAFGTHGRRTPGAQASKSSSTFGVSGRDWQASTNPSAFSSGSRA